MSKYYDVAESHLRIFIFKYTARNIRYRQTPLQILMFSITRIHAWCFHLLWKRLHYKERKVFLLHINVTAANQSYTVWNQIDFKKTSKEMNVKLHSKGIMGYIISFPVPGWAQLSCQPRSQGPFSTSRKYFLDATFSLPWIDDYR